MESFFLSETMKYLYLIFDDEHYLNTKGSMRYIFTTEGHLLPLNNVNQTESTTLDSETKKDDFSSFKCNPKTSKSFSQHFNRFNLPMKMKYFGLLFDMVGLNDSSNFLDRKSSQNR